MNIDAIARSVNLLQQKPEVRSKVAAGLFSCLGGISLEDEERSALQELAIRLENNQELPKHLVRNSMALAWVVEARESAS